MKLRGGNGDPKTTRGCKIAKTSSSKFKDVIEFITNSFKARFTHISIESCANPGAVYRKRHKQVLEKESLFKILSKFKIEMVKT